MCTLYSPASNSHFNQSLNDRPNVNSEMIVFIIIVVNTIIVAFIIIAMIVIIMKKPMIINNEPMIINIIIKNGSVNFNH